MLRESGDAEELLRAADLAMRESRRARRNKVEVCTTRQGVERWFTVRRESGAHAQVGAPLGLRQTDAGWGLSEDGQEYRRQDCEGGDSDAHPHEPGGRVVHPVHGSGDVTEGFTHVVAHPVDRVLHMPDGVFYVPDGACHTDGGGGDVVEEVGEVGCGLDDLGVLSLLLDVLRLARVVDLPCKVRGELGLPLDSSVQVIQALGGVAIGHEAKFMAGDAVEERLQSATQGSSPWKWCNR